MTRTGKNSHAGTPAKSTTPAPMPATLERGPEPKAKKTPPCAAAPASVLPDAPTRVYLRIQEMARAEGITITEVPDAEMPRSECRSIVDANDGLTGMLMRESVPTLRKAWLVATNLGFLAAGSPGEYPWANHNGVDWHEWAASFGSSVVASALVAETQAPAPERAAESTAAFDALDAIVQDLCGRIGIHPLELITLRYGTADCTRSEPETLERILREETHVGDSRPLGAALADGGIVPQAAGEWLDRGLRPLPIRLQRHDGRASLTYDCCGEVHVISPAQAVWRGADSVRYWLRDPKLEPPAYVREVIGED